MKADFQFGESYDRRCIHDRLGGSLEEYLPHVDGHVVCGCFKKEINPLVPHEVWLGSGPGVVRWASVFAQQKGPIPVFIKQAPNRWRYEGEWRVSEVIRDTPNIEAEGASPIDVAMILKLVKG